MRRAVVQGLLLDTEPANYRERRVVERMFAELREDKRFESLSDETLREYIAKHLAGEIDG